MDDLEVCQFEDAPALRRWLQKYGQSSPGIWLRIFRQDSGIRSVSFDEVLEAGLCFGWSESQRRRGDTNSYLQRFTSRRTKGTTSPRNLALVERLITEGSMTDAGLEALGRRRR